MAGNQQTRDPNLVPQHTHTHHACPLLTPTHHTHTIQATAGASKLISSHPAWEALPSWILSPPKSGKILQSLASCSHSFRTGVSGTSGPEGTLPINQHSVFSINPAGSLFPTPWPLPALPGPAQCPAQSPETHRADPTLPPAPLLWTPSPCPLASSHPDLPDTASARSAPSAWSTGPWVASRVLLRWLPLQSLSS